MRIPYPFGAQKTDCRSVFWCFCMTPCHLLALSISLLACTTVHGQTTAVRVIQPESRDFHRISRQPGTAEAFFEADLGAKVSGYVSDLLVDIGARVATGEVLARIAVPDMEATRSALSAEVEALRSEHDRTAMLVERGSLTQRALDEAANRLAAARANLREIDEQLRYATIEAPFDGIVTYRAIDPGDMVYEASSPKGSDQPLLRVARVDVIRVKTFVPELDAVWADIGDRATVAFDALPGNSYSGEIARVSGSLDPSTRTMQVEIDLPNIDGKILPGLYGRTEIALENHSGALALPATAVRFTETGDSYIYLIGANDVVIRRSVSIGFDDGNWIEISSGLSSTDRVADGLVGSLADGQQVQVIEP
jgi:RND family efflux transporter MFP subunit